MRKLSAVPLILALPLATACGLTEGRAAARWTGTMDTLPSGQVVVHNTADPVWLEGSEWQVVEEFRVGSLEGDGPDVFGSIQTMEVDPAGRLWVFDSQAQELRVFDETGMHLRTIGRRGGGPGEFASVVKVEMGPDGNIWVMDPQNNRISLFDTAGTYLEGRHAAGGFIIIPWPGRFDEHGNYYAPVPQRGEGRFRIGMVKYDASLTPIDTLEVPTDPIDRERFELRSEDGDARIIAGVPHQGGLEWKLARSGTIWAMMTDQYRIFALNTDGDTLRTITREFTPLPVTDEDLEQVREDMKWFTDQGGQIDLAKVPSTKPATQSFFFDDEGNLWVVPTTEPEEEGRIVEIFDPEGRYLGVVRLPFELRTSPFPIVRNGVLYCVTRDDLDVPYVVKARIVKPEQP